MNEENGFFGAITSLSGVLTRELDRPAPLRIPRYNRELQWLRFPLNGTTTKAMGDRDMKRLAMALLVVVAVVTTVTSAGADPGHKRPKITTFRFTRAPLKSDIDEVLRVVAHDPDSWISEIQVRWEDEFGDGGLLFAHTYCVQDPDFRDPGTPAKLTIPIQFDHPGNFHVEVRAISEIKCQAGNDEKSSRTLEKSVVVSDPLKSMSDAEDTSGPFDISSTDQTQESSETSATTEIVHRISTFETWTSDQLSGPAFMEMSFDLDNDESTFERVLTIDLDEDDSTIRASMLDPHSGQSRGYAAVTRPDDRTIEVSFPPLLVKKGLRSYRWYAYVDGGKPELCAPESPCTDRAPDSALMRHRL
jgi:hypothetical protein